MSMKVRKEKQRKEKTDKMVSFGKLLLCIAFLRVPVSSQVMSKYSHVVHECKTSVFFSFSLRELPLEHVMHVIQFWPGAIHSAYDAISVRGP